LLQAGWEERRGFRKLWTKGLPISFDDPRFERPQAERANVDLGPQDEQLVGHWMNEKRHLRFSEDGTIYRVKDGGERAVARWWYDYPDDVYEDPGAVGGGEVHWLDSDQVSSLRLESTEAKSLILQTGKKQVHLRKME